MLGLVVFGVGSALAGWAGTPTQLIVGRGVMGLGGAFVMPATLSTVTNIFPAGERTRAVAIWAVVPMVGIIAGPLVSGLLLEHFWWGSVILINVPLIPLALVATIMLVPDTRNEPRPRIDTAGAVFSFVALSTLLYAIIEVTPRGWTDGRVIAAGLGSALAFVAFVWWERRARSRCSTWHSSATPGSRPRASHSPSSSSPMAGMMFALSQYLQFVLGYTPLEAAVRLLPVALSSVVASLLSARLVGSLGRRSIVSTGLAVAALAFLLMSHVDGVSGYGIVAAAQVLLGFGIGLAMAPATDSIMDAVPRAKAGVGSAVNDTTREVGGALGVAVLGSVLASVYTGQMGAAGRDLPSSVAAVARDSLAGAFEVARALPDAAASRLMSTATAAFTEAMSTMLLVGAAVAMMGAVLALVFVPARRPAGAGDDSAPEQGAAGMRPAVGRRAAQSVAAEAPNVETSP